MSQPITDQHCLGFIGSIVQILIRDGFSVRLTHRKDINGMYAGSFCSHKKEFRVAMGDGMNSMAAFIHEYYINLFLVAQVIDGSRTPMIRTHLAGGMRQSPVPYNVLLTDHNYVTDALMRDEAHSIVIEPAGPERSTSILYSFNVTSCRIDTSFMRGYTPSKRRIIRQNHMFATFCKPLHTKLMDYLHTNGALSGSSRCFWMSPACAAAKRNHLYTKDESTVYPYGIGRLKNVNWQLFCHHHAKLFQSDVDIR